jgi:Domain of unknown function (DUF5911)
MNDFGLDLAVIGNGRTAALVDPSSRIVWWCYPRFDGDPIFSRLLAGGGAPSARAAVPATDLHRLIWMPGAFGARRNRDCEGPHWGTSAVRSALS